MTPTTAEIEHAEQRIEEAHKRLDDIYDRIVIDDTERVNGLSEEEITIHGSRNGMGAADGTTDGEKEHTNGTALDADGGPASSHVQSVVMDCQLCIKLAVEAVFELAADNRTPSNRVSFEDGQDVELYGDLPDDFGSKNDVVRVVLLTQFWDEFNELAKYGAPSANVQPETIFEVDDGSRAIDDAEYCIEIARELLEYARKNRAAPE